MRLVRWFLYVLAALVAGAALFLFPAAQGQAPATAEVAASPAHGSEPVISPVTGFNFAMSYEAQHNSATGWANIVVPTVMYRFNKSFALAASQPWYPTLNAYVSKTSGSATPTTLKSVRNALADTTANGSYQKEFGDLSYVATATGSFPTGDATYGLSAKQATYNVTNHFDYSVGPIDPDIEFGIGDNSTLANRSVKKAYTAVGTVANFQAGLSIELPFRITLDLEAYEDLPVGDQNVYGTVTSKNKKGVTVTKQVLEGVAVVEDNGFNTELDIPVGRKFTVMGTYERSLRQGLDTAAIGVTWTLRSPASGAQTK